MSLSSLARCIPLLLLLFLTTPPSFADPIPPDVRLPPANLSRAAPFVRTAVVPAGASLRVALSVPPNATLLLDAWYTSAPPHPHPLLLAGPSAPPLVQNAADAPPGVAADFEAFWTWRRYAYLLLHNRTTVHVRLYAHSDTLSRRLNATLRARLVPPDACPTGPRPHPCSANGACAAPAHCVCRPGFAGRFCEARVRPVSDRPFHVPPETMVYFRYDVPRNGSVAVRMHTLQPRPHPPTGQPLMFVKRAFENGGRRLPAGPPLPTVYDQAFVDQSSFLGRLPVQRVVRGHLRKGDRLYIGVYHIHNFFIQRRHGFTVGLLAPHAPVTVQLEAYPCVSRKLDGVRRCPAGGQEPLELSLTYLLLPLLLGTLTLLTMVVCVSVWAGVFRQHLFEVLHGHAPDDNLPRRDKLSEAEVNAMFPAFVFTKRETAALGATGDVCCSVCLSSFDEGELLRRLACGHSYHSTCLDRWLLTNATCPRCRKSARIHGDAGRGWLVRRHVMRVVSRLGAAFTWVSGFWGSSRTRDVPELESVEVEGLLPEREDSVSRRFVSPS